MSTYSPSQNLLPVGGTRRREVVTDVLDRDPKRGPVLDARKVARVIVAGVGRTAGTVESIVLNAASRGWEVRHLSPNLNHKHRFFQSYFSALATSYEGRRHMLADIDETLALRERLLDEEHVQNWFDLSEAVRISHAVHPILVITALPDRYDEKKKNIRAILELLSPTRTRGLGLMHLVIDNGDEHLKWSHTDDDRTAKLLLSSGFGTCPDMIQEMFPEHYKGKAARRKALALAISGGDLFAIGSDEPVEIDMNRASLPATSYRLKQLRVSSGTPRLVG